MRNKLILSLLCAAVLTGCGEYNKVLKSSDTNYKYEYAKKAFEERKYVQAATLLEDVVKVLKGTDKAEESLYLLGLSHYENKDYASASTYFQTYYTHYPKGKYTELARFYAGYGYYSTLRSRSWTKPTPTRQLTNFSDFLTTSPTATRSR